MDADGTRDPRSDRRLAAPQASEAFEYAVRAFRDATLIALTVSDPADMAAGGTEMGMATCTGEWTEIEERDVEYRFERVGALAEEHGVALETVVGRPARSIVEFAEKRDVDESSREATAGTASRGSPQQRSRIRPDLRANRNATRSVDV